MWIVVWKMRGLALLLSEQILPRVEVAVTGAVNFLLKVEHLLPESGKCRVIDCLLLGLRGRIFIRAIGSRLAWIV